jgi:type II secretory pathway component PulL
MAPGDADQYQDLSVEELQKLKTVREIQRAERDDVEAARHPRVRILAGILPTLSGLFSVLTALVGIMVSGLSLFTSVQTAQRQDRQDQANAEANELQRFNDLVTRASSG